MRAAGEWGSSLKIRCGVLVPVPEGQQDSNWAKDGPHTHTPLPQSTPCTDRHWAQENCKSHKCWMPCIPGKAMEKKRLRQQSCADSLTRNKDGSSNRSKLINLGLKDGNKQLGFLFSQKTEGFDSCRCLDFSG